jgi:hypothetical protein
VADGGRESEGCIGATTSGNGITPGPGRAKAPRVDVIFTRAPRQCADIGEHVAGTCEGTREVSPRATPTEEAGAGNPLVRIWRMTGMGNRPAYSTTAFSTARGAPAPTARRGWEYSLDAMSAACRDNFLNNVRQAELS